MSIHEGPKCLDERPKCISQKGPKCPIWAVMVGAEVVGAEVVGAEVSKFHLKYPTTLSFFHMLTHFNLIDLSPKLQCLGK